jgi:hypothetical protein
MCRYVLVLSDYHRQRASGQSRLCHSFIIYGSPAFPLLSRTPITKYILPCKVNSSNSTDRAFWSNKPNPAIGILTPEQSRYITVTPEREILSVVEWPLHITAIISL